MHVESRSVFNAAIRGPEEGATHFWNAIQESSIFKSHGHLIREHLHFNIPLGLHGDGGAFSHQSSLFCFAWNSLLSGGSGEGFARRFLFTVITEDECAEGTLDELLAIFAWSVNHLSTGITPWRDHNDLPLEGGHEYIAEGYRGTVIQVRGDWEFFSNVLKLAHWGNKINCWFLCKASHEIHELRYQDFTEESGWRATKRTHDSWVGELHAKGYEHTTYISFDGGAHAFLYI